jgi:hypothetical protein
MDEYLGAEKVMDAMSSMMEDDLIPEYVLRELRPGLAFWRARYGTSDSRFRERLRAKLENMQEDIRGEVGDLYEVLSGIDPKQDLDQSLVCCNLGRLLYLEWYHRGEPHDADLLEKTFAKSILLNSKNAFAHCWNGTFLKEMRRDPIRARKEYELALRLANGSKKPWLKDHPLFLNNLALMMLDDVQTKRVEPKMLLEAKTLLERASNRVIELKMDFPWPEQNLALCDALLREDQLRKSTPSMA